MNDISYTTEEIAAILKVSKLTVYDLIKKGELPAYRVGRQMRIDALDLEAYKTRAKKGAASISHTDQTQFTPDAASPAGSVIICGQDISLDILTKHMEKPGIPYRPLRSYIGSLNGLLSMYKGEAHIVSTHLWDGDTNEYNIPYIRKVLVGHRYLVVNLLCRRAGFYVSKENPKKIKNWADITRKDIRFVNREKGSGARVLLDEQLRLHNIRVWDISGYEREETNHLAVAGAVASGEADVGLGIEKASYIVGVDFIPLIEERYDLVMLKTKDNEPLRDLLLNTLRSPAFQHELATIGGYDLSSTGTIMYETY
ncbi:helix-turn-helix transcriptional regulator [Aneurinibacillus aneurinilyticus]|jgi:putative molybdopterin biosynthesis protein|uniref:Helix-turn-helix transcriptional regulator n=2 Tax=Aneurinibacillus aneurinilyticus TaxID=1391 RepID=A0A848CT10_ANEAE|nr:helix-turn-helix transcriptional regulator [Aneurinibacillus aneurinilyticus]ERI11444.1 DNA binding domain, excisionase family [Aneurinibacillus aneurinilyticus ATCC 12856]MCI1694230.1 helix-turn-helix transcriptional regulator [Aneurinibacillus aneurinilyticus]MED0671340.1 helix-turn-helix transcriptional regulator [Aneurinibacillus aneurinilyticus]MED0707764.1 helix-turn-helix transcriptional regulator [Aneurinibacillus aneurinilyticus]MED0722429.1 helix-turn-helix transcriptional regulat